MTRLTKYTIQLISGLLLALLTAGCVADRNVSDCITEGEDVELEFAVQVPALETSLRGLDATQEQAVKDIQLLVFNTQNAQGDNLGEPDETFAYEAEVKSKTQEGNTIRIRCGLKASPDKPMRVVCIANAPTKINTTDFTNKTKKTILEDDQMKKNFTAAWPTEGNSYYIPMWGESDKQTVTRNTKFNSCDVTGLGGTGVNQDNAGVIHLVRALARIDVGINFDEDIKGEKGKGSTDFKIKSVRVYRYATSMYMTGTQSTTFNFNGTAREAKPHTPEGVNPAVDTKPLKFEATEGVNDYVRNIYIPEISNQGDKNQRTCLVIGGYYNNSDKETYYRVDFIKREDGKPADKITKKLDVLRNHRYRFNITKIKGPGTSTPGEALTTEPVNISCDVVVWDEADIDKIMYDGQYYLSVSKDKFHFGKDATSESYKIRTNWPKGYKIVDKDGNEWAKTGTQGAWAYFTEPAGQTFKENKDMTSTVNVLENTTGKVRTITAKELFVKAGRIKWPLQITQSDKIELDVKVYEYKDGKWDPSKPINSWDFQTDVNYDFRVVFTPGADLERISLQFAEHFDWHRTDINKEAGYALYTVKLKKNSVPEDRFSLVETSRFRVTKGGVEAHTDFVTRYLKYDAIPYGDVALTKNMLKYDEVYPLSDISQKFYIKATAPYKLSVKKITIPQGDDDGKTELIVKGWKDGTEVQKEELGTILTGRKVQFEPYDYISGGCRYQGQEVIQASVTFELSSTDPSKPFETKTFTISLLSALLQPEANSYIMKLGQMPILIPCSQINRAADFYDQFADNFDLNCEYMLEKNYVKQKQVEEIKRGGGWHLNRLESTDTNWDGQIVWSTLTKAGNNPGLTVEKKRLTIRGRNYILVRLNEPKYSTPNDNPNPGTALVAAVKGGKVLWSWMIWVVGIRTDDEPDYPWLTRVGTTKSPKPYMNRNLGATRWAGSHLDPSFDIRKVGLYYQFGRPTPFHGEGKASGIGISTYESKSVDKVYYNTSLVPEKELTKMPIITGGGNGNAFWPMRMLIERPTQMCHRESNEGYIYEMGVLVGGTTTVRAAALWQGTDQMVLKNDARTKALYRTKKTPLDPCPYGWKVPAAGAIESMPITAREDLYLPLSGFFAAGNINDLRIGPADSGIGRFSAFHSATPYSNVDYSPLYFRLHWGNAWAYIYTNGDLRRCMAGAVPILPIECEDETDYLNYTEEGFKSLHNIF
ncbi:hypothetical protein PORUE0001_1281 [Porphyromonas uenonis 60-3]|uniref:DUF4906 domain-containing protein n=1 Tax=Porphyromonas uenonis 60-3 TaxID=596327 RepID=C2MCG6_9PORP|nr:hypothetical protein [Porphyromonas uenonis]EEK16589.1 hypothetical protein PORUE0001_1281 [Porphyromonas uenonis 60-3]